MLTEQDRQESNGDSKNTKEDDVSEKSSDSESSAGSPGSEEKDIVSLDALSLQYIVKNSNYRSILFDLLSPFIEESTSETASGHLAEDQSEKESRTIVHSYRIGREEELTPPLP